MRRLGFNAAIGAIAIGGQVGEPVARLIDSTGRPATPNWPKMVDTEQVERVGGLLTTLDLQYGGGLCSQLAKTVLRWAAAMLDTVSVATPEGRRMYGAISALTGRAAWAAFDTGAHEGARSLYRLALYTAVRSGDVNLRAHLLADAAAQHNHLGYHEDALNMIRLVEGDERVAPPVRMVLYGVKARVYAAAGAAELCRRHVTLAEQAHAEANPDPGGWQATLSNPTALAATTGHAIAVLHHHTSSPADLDNARQRLANAAGGLDQATHARATALCQVNLAALHLHAGDLVAAHQWTRRALGIHAATDSARLRRALTDLRTTTADHPADDATRQLAADIDNALATGSESLPN